MMIVDTMAREEIDSENLDGESQPTGVTYSLTD